MQKVLKKIGWTNGDGGVVDTRMECYSCGREEGIS